MTNWLLVLNFKTMIFLLMSKSWQNISFHDGPHAVRDHSTLGAQGAWRLITAACAFKTSIYPIFNIIFNSMAHWLSLISNVISFFFLGTNLWLWHSWIPLPCMRSSGISISKTRNIQTNYKMRSTFKVLGVSVEDLESMHNTPGGQVSHFNILNWFPKVSWNDSECSEKIMNWNQACLAKGAAAGRLKRRWEFIPLKKLKEPLKILYRKDYFVKKWNSSRNCQPPSRARQR